MIKKILYLKILYKIYIKNNNDDDFIGFKFNYNKNSINIEYKNKNYTISIDKEKNIFHLKLIPYGKSFFSTEINLREIKMKANMSLFAIKKNDEVYG